MVTEQEARDMNIAITAFQNTDKAADEAQHNQNIRTAETWFNTLGINIPAATTRDQALTNFRSIQAEQTIQTDRFRLIVLRSKLNEANEKFKTIKAL